MVLSPTAAAFNESSKPMDCLDFVLTFSALDESKLKSDWLEDLVDPIMPYESPKTATTEAHKCPKSTVEQSICRMDTWIVYVHACNEHCLLNLPDTTTIPPTRINEPRFEVCFSATNSGRVSSTSLQSAAGHQVQGNL